METLLNRDRFIMDLFSSPSEDNLRSFFRVVLDGMKVRNDTDLIRWLQGEMQHYLPHEVMFVAWGDFEANCVQYDIISPLPGIRAMLPQHEDVSEWLRRLYWRWLEKGGLPYSSMTHHFGNSLQGMQSFLVHGICDQRRQEARLYIIFNSNDKLNEFKLHAMKILLPYLDTTVRQIFPFRSHPPSSTANLRESNPYRLSEREVEIMHWVRKGKTNPEISKILFISLFTVKNHMCHILRKLGVYNRVQAISKLSGVATTLRQASAISNKS